MSIEPKMIQALREAESKWATGSTARRELFAFQDGFDAGWKAAQQDAADAARWRKLRDASKSWTGEDDSGVLVQIDTFVVKGADLDAAIDAMKGDANG